MSRKPEPLVPQAELVRRLAEELPAWRGDGLAIERDLRTDGWPDTVMAANAVAYLAEAADHHPSMQLDYARLAIRLWTHDVGGVTERDLALARRIDQVLAR